MRLYVLVARPLWADEIFTLRLARLPLTGIVDALRLDSGPPLHYLLAKLLLRPFPEPGSADILIRVASVFASLLHLPVLVRLGTRLDSKETGFRAAAVFSLYPLAIYYATEGRAYAMASLMVLVAFERALALRDSPSPGRAVVLGVLAAAAFLTHYLSLVPLVGLLWVFWKAPSPVKRQAFFAGLLASALAAGWLPIALYQPAGAMSWIGVRSVWEAALHVVVNTALGIEVGDPWVWALVLAAIAVLVLAARGASKNRLDVVVGFLGMSAGALALLQIVKGSVLVPERTALLVLPLVALIVGGSRPLSGLAGTASLIALGLQLRGWISPLPSEDLARRLLPDAAAANRICAVGLWGPELDYRLARAGARHQVILFPSDVAFHPGWYEEDQIPEERLRDEARRVARTAPIPELFVLPVGLKASSALRQELEGRPLQRIGLTPYFEVLRVRPGG